VTEEIDDLKSGTGAEPGKSGSDDEDVAENDPSRQGQGQGDKTFTQAELSLAIEKAVTERLGREKEAEKRRQAEAERRTKEAAAREAGQFKELWELEQQKTATLEAELEAERADRRTEKLDGFKGKVAAKFFIGYKPDQVDEFLLMLRGETEDEIEAHAKKLVKLYPVANKAPDLQGGEQGKKGGPKAVYEQAREQLSASGKYMPN
jgi:hypothetical protein